MKLSLKIGDANIAYSLVKGKSDQVRLSFTENNLLRIESGSGELGRFEMEFIEKNKRWILNSYKTNHTEGKKRERFFDELETVVPLLGEKRMIKYLISHETRYHYTKEKEFVVQAPANIISDYRIQLLRHALFAFASSYIRVRTRKWAEEIGLHPQKISVKTHKSKWGSCSSNGNINLNWYLIFLDKKMLDYVLIHEIMHLQELNHSASFWRLVEQYVPDHKFVRKQLADNQWVIGILE